MPLKDGDARNDMNNRSSIRRWASLNAVPSFTAKAKPDTDENKTTVKAANKTAAAPTPAEHELSRAEFFRLCEWVRTAINATVPNLEALSIAATKHIGHAVSEETVREAMELTSTPEPEHWKPIEPHVVVARELDALMKSLGQPTSPAFKRLMESLA
ncbi:MAG: hypothetical protein ACREUF_19230 [Solimonas sp.]